MTTMTDTAPRVTGGVDTHKDTHVAAALDELGRVLGTAMFPATPAGYRQLLAWMRGFGEVVAVGVEGTGSWGAGLARYLTANGVRVIEVTRPNRQHRRRHGKSDPADAIGAARAVLAGEATGTPKAQTGTVEAIRLLRVARRSAVKARTQAANQLHAVVDTAPAQLRQRLGSVNTDADRGARGPVPPRPSGHANRSSQAHPASPGSSLAVARRRDRHARRSPRRTHHRGGANAARDQRCRPPERRRPAHRRRRQPGPAAHRRLVRRALRHLADRRLLRPPTTPPPQPRRRPSSQLRALLHRDEPLRWHQPTKTYMARRIAEGRTTKEIIRCLKRYVAIEVHRAITIDLGRTQPPDRHKSPLDIHRSIGSPACGCRTDESWCPCQSVRCDRDLRHGHPDG